MVATSGDRLIAEETAQALVQALFPLASLITPNLDEAGWLIQQTLSTTEAMQAAAQRLQAMGRPMCWFKAGICRAMRWSMCCSCKTVAPGSWPARVLLPTTATARVAPCRRPLRRIWPRGLPCPRRCKPGATQHLGGHCRRCPRLHRARPGAAEPWLCPVCATGLRIKRTGRRLDRVAHG